MNFDIRIKRKENHSKKENIKIQYKNELIQNMGLGDPLPCVYQIMFMTMKAMIHKLYNMLLCIDWKYVSS